MENAALDHERLIESLCDDAVLEEYKRPLDGYRAAPLPRLLGGLLVWCGNAVYGTQPSHLKFPPV